MQDQRCRARRRNAFGGHRDGSGTRRDLWLLFASVGVGKWSGGRVDEPVRGVLARRGVCHGHLWAPRDNPRARAFYEKAGWHATGEESTFSPPDPPEAALPKIEVVVTQYEVRL